MTHRSHGVFLRDRTGLNLHKLILLVSLAVFLLGLVSSCFAQEEGDIGSLLSELISSPAGVLSFVIQLGLGLGLGFFSLKVLKHIIALIGILIVGMLLNTWQFGGLQSFARRIGLENWSELYPFLRSLASAVGILTILPTGLGFFIGIVIAARR